MAWVDKATETQVNAFLHIIRWDVTREDMRRIYDYLMENANRMDMSHELGRVKWLREKRNLSKATIFEGPLWEKFEI